MTLRQIRAMIRMEVIRMAKKATQVKLADALQEILDNPNGHPAPLYQWAGEPWNPEEFGPAILVGPGEVALHLYWGNCELEETRSGIYRQIPLPILVKREELVAGLREALPHLLRAARGARAYWDGQRWAPDWPEEAEEALEEASAILTFGPENETPLDYADDAVWGNGPRTLQAFAEAWGDDLADLLLRGEAERVAAELYDYFCRIGVAIRGGLDDLQDLLQEFLEDLE